MSFLALDSNTWQVGGYFVTPGGCPKGVSLPLGTRGHPRFPVERHLTQGCEYVVYIPALFDSFMLFPPDFTLSNRQFIHKEQVNSLSV